MKVIYGGFSKTGTKTMAEAFRILGLTCYDSLEYYVFQGDQWSKIFVDGGSVDDFRRMFEGVDAVTDVPGAFYWEQILEAYPDAKVAFGMRADEDTWWRSMKQQILSNDNLIIKLIAFFSPTMRKMEAYFYKAIGATFHFDFDKPFLRASVCNEMLIRKSYRRHNAYLLENVPKDRMMTIDLSAGWEPLCRFLGLPVPSRPFPHKNKGADLIEDMLETSAFMLRMKYEMLVITSLLAVAFSLISYKTVRNRSSLFSAIKTPSRWWPFSC